MFRLLSKEARAPLPVVVKEIKRFERKARRCSAMSAHEFNQTCIQILHNYGWRVRDYHAELNRCHRRARELQRSMCKPPLVP